MLHTLRTNEDGSLHVPAEVLGRATPHAGYTIEVREGELILRPAVGDPNRQVMTPEEHARRWREWAEGHERRGTGLPDEALSRDSMYD